MCEIFNSILSWYVCVFIVHVCNFVYVMIKCPTVFWINSCKCVNTCKYACRVTDHVIIIACVCLKCINGWQPITLIIHFNNIHVMARIRRLFKDNYIKLSVFKILNYPVNVTCFMFCYLSFIYCYLHRWRLFDHVIVNLNQIKCKMLFTVPIKRSNFQTYIVKLNWHLLSE